MGSLILDHIYILILLYSVLRFLKLFSTLKVKEKNTIKKMILKSSELQVYTKLRTKKAGSSLLIKINKLLNY